MKHLYLICTLLLTLNLSKAQVVSYELIQSFSIADMNQIVSDFGASGAITPAYPVDLYRVYYRTEYNDSLTTVTGALAIPQNVDCKPPLISYQHGTTARKLGVPSYGSAEQQILLVFASEGNILVAPDYIGLGGSTINLHPYQHGYSQAHSSINMLRAARELQTDLSYELSNQLYLFGYSQGGHATAATLKYIEEDYSNEFQVTAAMPMSGAYDLSGTQTDFISNGQAYATPGYLPYIVMGYQSVYHDLYDSIQEVFIPPYDSIMPYLLIDHNYSIGYINGQADPIPVNMFTPQAQNRFFNDPSYPFSVRLKENDLLDWTPQSTIRMYYCTGDEQVYYRNSVVADSIWNLNGAPDASAVFLTNEDHGGCVDDALIAARLFFGNLKNNGVEILVEYDANTNSFVLDVLNEDINDFDIEWGGGETTSTLNNVADNVSYEVTLTNKVTGCGNSRRFTKDAALGVNTISEIETLNIYPNPSSQYIIVDARFEENKTMNIIDSQGKSVFTFDYIKGTEPMINVASLSSGKYYLHVDGQIDYLGSFIKK